MIVTPSTSNLTIFSNAHFEKQFTWSYDGTPVDLTNWTAKLQARNMPNGDKILIDIDETTGITLGASGTIDILIPLSDTITYTFDVLKYDLCLYPLSPADEGYRLVEGTITLNKGITS